MAIQNDLQNAELGYILCPFESYTNINGKPLVGGWITLYEAGTDTKYISYQDWQGAFNPFKIPIPADGRVVALGDPTKTYDAYLYNSFGDLVCSRLNLECNVAGNISIKGADTRIKNTDGTLDVSLRTLGNNVREYTVNTHNKVLDVQEPLYFVENSNTATVIGFSGDNYATTADLADKMDISKLEYNNDGEISAYDGSAFAGGQGGAGDPEVNDLVHSNSATWNDVSAKLDTTAFSTVSGNFLTAIPDDYATKDYVQSSVSSKLDSTAFSTVSGNFLTAHQSLDGLMSASLLGISGSTITSYNNMPFPLGGEGDAEVNQIVHANSADWNNVSAKLDTTAFSTVSGNFLTAHQSLAGYLTKTSADTLYQPIGDYADATALDGKVDTSSFTAFSSTTNEKIEYISGALSGTYELSAGEGIDITDYPNEQKTVISVTAQGGNPEVENLVTAQSATWDSVTGKADATALNDYATTSQLANKLDTTAFSDVSGTFLTAHQDLSDYQTTAGMTAYQPAGSYLTADALDNVSANWNEVSAKLDTTAFSDVSGSFLTAVPDTYLQNTDLTIVDNKITEISGVPLSAGDELPASVSATTDYVTATSANINSTIDNVSANSGVWGGSALPISAGPGVKISLQNDTLVFSTDETVLWSGTTGTADHTTAFTLTEPLTNFERIRFEGYQYGQSTPVYEITIPNDSTYVGVCFQYFCFNDDRNPYQIRGGSYSSNNGLDYTVFKEKFLYWSNTSQSAAGGNTNQGPNINKIVGINRIAGGN